MIFSCVDEAPVVSKLLSFMIVRTLLLLSRVASAASVSLSMFRFVVVLLALAAGLGRHHQCDHGGGGHGHHRGDDESFRRV